MCDSCGKDIKDVALRAASYGGVRWLSSMGPFEAVIEKVGDIANVTSESSHPLTIIAVKTGVSAAVDYIYGTYVYPKFKMGYGDKAGLCECEYMTGMWQIAAQALYEKIVKGRISGEAVIKDVIAIYAQFPISKFLKKSLPK